MAAVHSPTLAVNEKIRARQEAGKRVLHLGFGEAGLPVLPEAADALRAAAGRTSYGPVAGLPEVREAAAGWFGRRAIPTTGDRILVAPGSKALLYALFAALPGDILLPRPAWVSYAAQAALLGRRAIPVDISADGAGGIPDAAALEAAITEARAAGRTPGVLLLTLPDNPTGTAANPQLVRAACETAERHDLTIVSDEIYRDLRHDLDAPFLSPAEIAPERTAVTSGLSKAMALGGWRFGFARVPDGPRGDALVPRLLGIASEIWSAPAGPVQAAAAQVLQEPPAVRARVEASRRLHAAVARAVHAEFTAAGARCRTPEAGFYLYPDLEALRPALAARGIDDGAALADHLLDEHGVGVLTGAAFGDDPRALRFRAATSLLYGTTDEQRARALDSTDPAALPWIAEHLAHLRTALAALRG